MSDNIVLLFLANTLNAIETKREGYSPPVRWLCLREDLQAKYIEQAQEIVDEWWADEQRAKTAREIPVGKNAERRI